MHTSIINTIFIVVRAALLFAQALLPLLLPQQLHHPAGVRLIISLLQRIELVPFWKFFGISSGNDPAVIGTHNFVNSGFWSRVLYLRRTRSEILLWRLLPSFIVLICNSVSLRPFAAYLTSRFCSLRQHHSMAFQHLPAITKYLHSFRILTSSIQFPVNMLNASRSVLMTRRKFFSGALTPSGGRGLGYSLVIRFTALLILASPHRIDYCWFFQLGWDLR
jgi:hypothetical protein